MSPSWTLVLVRGGAGVFKFPTHWADEIVEVSTLPEFQNALVSLIDPDKVELDYDWVTDTETVTNDGVVWSGQARIIAVQQAKNRENDDTANSKAITNVRVQFPYRAVGRVRRGVILRVDECERNPVLEELVFTVSSDFQGSSAGARTILFVLDGDSQVSDAEEESSGS